MAPGALINLLPQLREASLESLAAKSDADLLERFVASRDEAAFEVMVRRHGPMVFGVCLRVLRHNQDAEDAFQATFLVLAHRATSVSPRSKLAGWLHGVAHKTALKARHRSALRQQVEMRVRSPSADEMRPELDNRDAELLLDQEIAGLPERYRLPIILCDLEGRLRTEAAQVLRCSEGTLSSRLTRGRRLLAEKLKRRGMMLSATATAFLLTHRSPVMADSLVQETIPVVLSSLASGAGIASAASPSVAELATGVMKSMFLKKLQMTAVALLAAAAIILTALSSYQGKAAPVPAAAAPVPASDGKGLPPALTEVDGHLLLNRKVLRDMKCDIDQLDRIFDLLEEAEKKSQQKMMEALNGQLRGNPGGLNPQAIQQVMKDAQETGEKEFRKGVEGVTTTILTQAQIKRLREIDIQVRGYEAFSIPAVVKALELSDKQKDEMEKNAKQVEDQIARLSPLGAGAVGGFGGGGGIGGGGGGGGGRGGVVVGGVGGIDFQKYEKDVEHARAEGLKRAVAILTTSQKETWKKLVGEPITFPISGVKGMQGYRFGGVNGGFGFGGGGMMPLPAAPVPPAPPAPPKPVAPPPQK